MKLKEVENRELREHSKSPSQAFVPVKLESEDSALQGSWLFRRIVGMVRRLLCPWPRIHTHSVQLGSSVSSAGWVAH